MIWRALFGLAVLSGAVGYCAYRMGHPEFTPALYALAIILVLPVAYRAIKGQVD